MIGTLPRNPTKTLLKGRSRRDFGLPGLFRQTTCRTVLLVPQEVSLKDLDFFLEYGTYLREKSKKLKSLWSLGHRQL